MSRVFEEGCFAFRMGDNVTDNPYRSDSFEYLEWIDGWLAIKEHRERIKRYISPGSWVIRNDNLLTWHKIRR